MAALAPVAARAADKVLYGPPPAWVSTAAIAATPTADSADGADNGVSPPVKVLVADTQSKFTVSDVTEYVATRVKLLTPEGLPLGSFSREWDPSTDTLTVHRLRVERDGQVIDVLEAQKFEVLRRERSLEQSMLDGRLTATLQISDLRVGDTLDVAMSLTRSQPVLAGRNSSSVMFPPTGVVEKTRVRMVWDKAAPLRWRVGAGLPQASAVDTATGGEMLFEAANLTGPTPPEGSPLRYRFAGVIEASQAESWREVSRSFLPAFDKAAALEPNSPLKAEIERIRKAGATPMERASLALKLVEDNVRYVAINMNAQGYTPAAADETWRRRFGDCKGKTALLIALLRGLDIDAKPALVQSVGGDALTAFLPRADSFDHVIVRAAIDGRVFWLDGTRTGDGPLEAQIKPYFGWALPLTAKGAELERLRPDRPERPTTQLTLRVDGSGGLDKETPVELQVILRDRDAGSGARAMAATPKAQLERSLTSRYQDFYSGVRLTSVDWRYDEAQSRVVMNFKGSAKPEFTKSGDTVSYEIPGSALYAPDLELRPESQDQAAPYDVNDVEYERRLTVVKLPKDGKTYTTGDAWSYQLIGGELRTRWTERRGDEVVMLLSNRGIVEEISAAEMSGDVEVARRYRSNAQRIVGRPARKVEKPTPAGQTSEGRIPLAGYTSVNSTLKAELANLGAQRRDELLGFTANLRALQDKKDYAGILKALDQTKLDLTPLGSGPAETRYFALSKLNRDAEALTVLDEAIAKAPTVPLLINRAYLHSKAGREALDKADTEAALKLNPDSILALQMAIASADIRSDYPRQIELRRRIVRLQPDEPEEWLRLGAFATATEQFTLAQQAYTDAGEAGVDETNLLVARAGLAKKMKRSDEEMAYYDQAIAKSPDRPELLNNACWARAISNLQLEKALGECQRAVAIAPQPHRLDSLAFVQLRLGNLTDSIANYDKALAKNAKLPASLYGRGVAKIRNGQVDAGRADIASAVALAPKIAESFATYGVTAP